MPQLPIRTARKTRHGSIYTVRLSHTTQTYEYHHATGLLIYKIHFHRSGGFTCSISHNISRRMAMAIISGGTLMPRNFRYV